MARSLKIPTFEYEWQADLWKLEHPDWREETNAYFREWARKNRDKRTSAQERWREKHPERNREINRLAQARRRAKDKALKEAERRAIELEEERQRKVAEAEARAIAEYEAILSMTK